MEYVDGNPLDKMIGQDVGPIPWGKALPLFTQILDGIGYAHSKNIVHRDIKPANILISKEGTVKVTDLGIAKIAGEQGMTRTGAQMGTLYYESPEQIKGAKDVDHRSDIFSLGMTLYEMLAGRLSFDKGGDTSEFALMNSVVNRADNLDPREYYPHIPEWLVKTIQKATDLNPEKRFQSCEHFKQVIEKYGKLSELENTFWSEKVASVKTFPVQPSRPISTHSTPPTASLEEQCPECNSPTSSKMKFCDNCGYNLFKLCPECKTNLPWYKKFCFECGAKITHTDDLIKDAISKKEINLDVKKSDSRFLKEDNIITDKETGLKWQVGSDKNTNWKKANKLVNSFEGNWRMPSLAELRELYEAGITYKNWGYFQNSGHWVWSSESEYSSSALFFYFTTGSERCTTHRSSNNGRVFAVSSP